jgi:polyhydroxybutyrate depolymerase
LAWLSIALAVFVCGCRGAAATPQPSPGNTSNASLTTADGLQRTYILHLPPGLSTTTPVPLLIALHGGGGNGAQFEANSGFDALADQYGFVVVYPDGTSRAAQGPLSNLETWNGGACCGSASADGVDDVAFISQLIDALTARYSIDATQIFAAGHSNGGILAYRLACELAGKIVAVGVQSAALEIDTCDPSLPVSLLHIHGTADDNILIDGGAGAKSVSGVDFRPAIDSVTAIANADGCASQPQTLPEQNPDLDIDVWTPCQGGTEVEFVKVNGAGHAWMGHAAGAIAQALVGPPYMGYDSSAAIWAFVAAHPRN